VYPSMLFFLCSLRRDQRVSVSTDGLCYREKLEGIPIYHTDCLNQQGRFWWTAWNWALGPTVFSPGEMDCVAPGQVQSSLTMPSRTTNPPLLHTLLELSLETIKPGTDANVQHVCEGIDVCISVSPNVSWCAL